jgi:hypothetical protein
VWSNFQHLAINIPRLKPNHLLLHWKKLQQKSDQRDGVLTLAPGPQNYMAHRVLFRAIMWPNWPNWPISWLDHMSLMLWQSCKELYSEDAESCTSLIHTSTPPSTRVSVGVKSWNHDFKYLGDHFQAELYSRELQWVVRNRGVIIHWSCARPVCYETCS